MDGGKSIIWPQEFRLEFFRTFPEIFRKFPEIFQKSQETFRKNRKYQGSVYFAQLGHDILVEEEKSLLPTLYYTLCPIPPFPPHYSVPYPLTTSGLLLIFLQSKIGAGGGESAHIATKSQTGSHTK